MAEFGGNFEGKIETPEQNPIPEMSFEAEGTFCDLFKDDFDGLDAPKDMGC